MKHLFAFLFLLGITFSLSAQSVRERILLDDGWQFAFGNASSPEKDFGCGTEYFNYLTKAASIHNEGPYSPKFNPEKWGVDWKTVNLPFADRSFQQWSLSSAWPCQKVRPACCAQRFRKELHVTAPSCSAIHGGRCPHPRKTSPPRA